MDDFNKNHIYTFTPSLIFLIWIEGRECQSSLSSKSCLLVWWISVASDTTALGYRVCDYLSMLVLKFTNISQMGPSCFMKYGHIILSNILYQEKNNIYLLVHYISLRRNTECKPSIVIRLYWGEYTQTVKTFLGPPLIAWFNYYRYSSVRFNWD